MYGVRPMVAEDLGQVTELEQEAFPEQRPPTSFARELQNKLAGYLVLYCEEETSGGLLLGYAGLWFIGPEAHLLSIAVRQGHRRRGLGELLLIAGLELAARRDVQSMTLEVRVSNVAAQALYEKYGFVQVGRRLRYYPDNNEDAFLMTVEGICGEPYLARLQELKEAYVRRHGRYLALPE